MNKSTEVSNTQKPANCGYTVLPAVVPSQSDVDYSKVKQTCLCGVSVNLCDKVIMPDYGKRCPCVVSHYNGC